MAKLYFRYGAMNSGKSTHLLQVAHNYEERGMRIYVVKSILDSKGEDYIVSRMGSTRKVDILLKIGESIFDYFKSSSDYDKIACVLVDEAQFLTVEQVEELYELAKVCEIPVICYGLRTDFMNKGFPGSTRLLEIADDIEEMKTICKCGKKATVNVRYVKDKPVFSGDQILIDNVFGVRYEPMCGKCYIVTKRLGYRK